MKNKERIAILEAEISRLKVANRNNIYRIEQIESHLAERHKGANFSKLNSSEIPNTCLNIKPEAPECVANNGVSSEPSDDAILRAENEILALFGEMKSGEAKQVNREDINAEMFKIMRNTYDVRNLKASITPDFIPDWKDAPEDAVCVAMDGNGDWFWYNRKTSGVYGFVFIGAPIKIAGKATNADLLPLNYWKSTLMMRPESISDAPNYTHLLPDGYEFCLEADAEKWVKVEMLDVNDNDEYELGHINDFSCFIGRWRPIRPIQYKVTTHEITTAVPDPYQPDWSKAPEGTVAHAWDEDAKGFWYIVKMQENVFGFVAIESHHTLPADLDWKQSLRVKPN
jgi:hypothetical protein